METWSEFQWWHGVFMVLILLGPVAGFLWRFNKTSSGIALGWCGTSAFWLLIYPALVLISGSPIKNFYFADGTDRFAVVDKSDNIIAHHLRIATLKPWPLSEYRVVRYPAKISFAINIQPITKNPKVVPLEVNMAVRVRDGMSGEQIKEYILSQKKQELVALEFKKQVFDFLQHRLPQDEAMRLNPFDQSSIDHFYDLLSKELNSRLEFHQVADVGLSVR